MQTRVIAIVEEVREGEKGVGGEAGEKREDEG
jgi:hypothetical protein